MKIYTIHRGRYAETTEWQEKQDRHMNGKNVWVKQEKEVQKGTKMDEKKTKKVGRGRVMEEMCSEVWSGKQ